MIETLAVNNYRSLRDIVMPLSQLTVISGVNGSGKSNLYKALRLLAKTSMGGLVKELATEGGLKSVFWAGPESISRRMRSGEVPVEGTRRKKPPRLNLGFKSKDLSYSISLGTPSEEKTLFSLDPEIKRESIWAGDYYHPNSVLIDRKGGLVRIRSGRKWEIHPKRLNSFESILSELSDPVATPEIFNVRQLINGWRFYDHFRIDAESPIRIPQVGTRTEVLSHHGHDLLAALQTIIEVGDHETLYEVINDAFPESEFRINVDEGSQFSLAFKQKGLLRSLKQSELSDGTLRYFLLVAALLTPRPPSLMVLNEPETSLHPDLIFPLSRLILKASKLTQLWVVTHNARLLKALDVGNASHKITLKKDLQETMIEGQGLLDRPSWSWHTS